MKTCTTGVTNETIISEKLELMNEQKMCFENFLLKLKSHISSYCQIPVSLPSKQLIDIINRAKKWFYKHYEYSVEEGYLYLNSALYETDLFKRSRSVLLPDEIYSVYGVHKLGNSQRVLGHDSQTYSNSYFSFGNESTFEDLMSYVVGEKYSSLRQDILSHKYTAFSFNNLTHRIRFAGEKPKSDIVLEVYKTINDCELFNDEIFFRYVSATAFKDIGRILSTFEYQLPGNITLNHDSISSYGIDELEKIETEIREDESSDWFFSN